MTDTNTIQVAVPQGVDLQPATDALKRFGDISHIEVFPGTKPILQVVYFDVRCADLAHKTLGSDRCKVAPQTGSRIVHLPGSMQLSADNLRNVSSLKPDDNGALIVEYFDTRDAQRMQDIADAKTIKAPPGLEAPPGLQLPAGLEPPPGLAPPGLIPAVSVAKIEEKPVPTPVYIPLPSDVKLGMPVAVEQAPCLPAEGPQLFEVLLQSVPKNLCCGGYLEAMLEQAGLDTHLVSCRVLTGADLGEALLKLSNKRAAKKCVKHFNGRRWDLVGNCPAVKATLLQADHEVEETEKSAVKSSSLDVAVAYEQTNGANATTQYQEAMAQYFSSAAGQQLLRDESSVNSTLAEMEEKGDKFNWEAVSDVSDGEHGGLKPRKAMSDASTVDGSSDAGDQEVF